MKTLLEKIAVMQAAADGKVIQTDFQRAGTWVDNPSPTWDWGVCDYRVKPREPKVIYVNEYPDGSRGAFTYKSTALRVASSASVRKAVKYREVIEDEEH